MGMSIRFAGKAAMEAEGVVLEFVVVVVVEVGRDEEGGNAWSFAVTEPP